MGNSCNFLPKNLGCGLSGTGFWWAVTKMSQDRVIYALRGQPALGFITHGPPSSFNKKPKTTFPAFLHTFGYLPTLHSANTYG